MPEAARVGILLLDDHEIFREGLRRILAGERGLQVVASCGSAEEALGVLASSRVDLVLLDIELGGVSGVEFLARARRAGFAGKVLVVTAGLTQREAGHLVKWGIVGIFLKRDSPAELAGQIRSVMAGDSTLDEETLHALSEGRQRIGDDVLRRPLTARQRQVLQMVFEGLANKEIAARLELSEASVKATLQELFEKAGVRTRAQLVRFAIEKYGDQMETPA